MNEKQKVLIVDDEPRNQRIIVETLEDLVEYKTSSSGEEALKTLETFLPDLVLLDIMMPGLDGYEVCRKIRSNPKLNLAKVILVSGKAMIDERLKGYEVGADDYMTKPFVPEELLAKAKVFLRLASAEKQLDELNQSLEQKVEERTKQLLDAEAKMVTSVKMSALGEMAGGIAHEINTPLSTIGMLGEEIGELMNSENIDRKTIGDMTLVITQTVHRIGAIVRGLRTFSRDGSQDRFDSVPVRKVVDDTLVLCSEKIKMAGIQLQSEEIPKELTIQCRSVQLSQVFLNILSNACDAIQPLQEKWIKIAATKHGNMVQISITDSGKGMSEKVRDKIFQPFFTTKEVGKGTGLGLSVSKGIIDAHKGTISVDAKSANTRFVIEIPTEEKAA